MAPAHEDSHAAYVTCGRHPVPGVIRSYIPIMSSLRHLLTWACLLLGVPDPLPAPVVHRAKQRSTQPPPTSLALVCTLLLLLLPLHAEVFTAVRHKQHATYPALKNGKILIFYRKPDAAFRITQLFVLYVILSSLLAKKLIGRDELSLLLKCIHNLAHYSSQYTSELNILFLIL